VGKGQELNGPRRDVEASLQPDAHRVATSTWAIRCSNRETRSTPSGQ
jgi:hypothetical protein